MYLYPRYLVAPPMPMPVRTQCATSSFDVILHGWRRGTDGRDAATWRNIRMKSIRNVARMHILEIACIWGGDNVRKRSSQWIGGCNRGWDTSEKSNDTVTTCTLNGPWQWYHWDVRWKKNSMQWNVANERMATIMISGKYPGLFRSIYFSLTECSNSTIRPFLPRSLLRT